jgi:hypothetical protein
VLENAQKLGQLPRQVAASINLITTPPNVNDWVGRSEEVAQLQTWLADASVNLIGIQGLGGVGKSAMAAYLYGLTSPPAPLLRGEGSKSKSQISTQSQTPTPTHSPPFPHREGRVVSLSGREEVKDEARLIGKET